LDKSESIFPAYQMEWIKHKDFPEEMTANTQNLDSALSEMEAVVNALTSVPLTEVHSCVSFVSH
jgi:hypothetical protein